MIEKINLKQLLLIVGIGLALCFVFGVFGKPGKTINDLQADTDRTMGAIKAEQSSTGVEIDRSQTATGNALQAIERSQIEIDGSRKAVDGIEARIRELQTLVVECQRLAGESKTIINNIDGAN